MPAPRKKSAASFELSSSTATRSPGLSPSAISPFARRQPRSHALAKVRRSLPCTTASRSAKNEAARRIALVTSMLVPCPLLARRGFLALPGQRRADILFQEVDHRLGEGVVLVARHHVSGAAHV